MENCPPTPLILTGRDSKSPLQVALSSPEPDEMKSPSRDSPDSRCVICLGRLQNKSFTDSCLHQFCFQCLLQWSKIKAECPLCKQPFKSIIHNVRSNLDYDQYHVERREPHYMLSDLMHSYNFDLIPVERRFRYRSTMTREYFRELAVSFLAHTRRFPEDSYQINPLVPVDPAPAPRTRRSNRLVSSSSQRRTKQRGTSDFRRNIYAQDLWVQDLADISGRYRECTPQFYRDNPAQIHRIIPWLNREVNVLLGDCESYSAYVLSRIISLLTQHPIRSREFRDQIHSYFGDRTEHFIHELYIFARSIYDIAGFDQNAVYNTNPNYATEVQEISSSTENDSDIEVIETVKSEEKKSRKSSRHGPKKLLLKTSDYDDSKSDEPVAGPSGINSRTGHSIEICESDSEEIKVLDYVKPEPEVVTISSEEEAVVYSDLNTSDGEYAKVIRMDKLGGPLSSEDEKKTSRSRSGKGKCKSNGFGLKGKQKRKYIKARHRSSSTSSRSSSRSTSSSSSPSCSSKKWTSASCLSSDSSLRCSSRSRRKKAKTYKRKLKKKDTYRSSHKKHKVSSDTEKKKKRVKSCVIVPSRSCDSSPSPQKISSRSSDKPRQLKSYWSVNHGEKYFKCRQSPERNTRRKSQDDSVEDKSKKRHRDVSRSPDRSLLNDFYHSYSTSSTSANITSPSSTSSRANTSHWTLSPKSGSANLPFPDSLPVRSETQTLVNSD